MSRRPVDGVSLAFGLFFLAAAALWLTARLLTLPAGLLGWTVAGGLIAVGVAGIAGALVGNQRRHADDPDR